VIAGAIVLLSLALGAAFAVVWLARPDVRARIERPKHRFQSRVRQYDRACRASGGDHAHD
jgi:hypothetical protein